VPELQRGRQSVPLEMASEIEHRRRLAMQANAGIPVLRDFVPVLKFGGATTGITYDKQVGKSATWAGVIHEVWIEITLTSKGSAPGAATISGLLETNNSGLVVCSADFALHNAAGNQSNLKSEVQDGAAVIDMYHSHGASTGAGTLLSDSNFTDTTDIHLHIVYRVV